MRTCPEKAIAIRYRGTTRELRCGFMIVRVRLKFVTAASRLPCIHERPVSIRSSPSLNITEEFR
jgi:hypothetical protein